MKSYFFIFFIFFGCQLNELDVDISEVDLKPLTILRLDNDLFAFNESNFDLKTKGLKLKYGFFYERYLMNPIGVNNSKDSLYKKSVLSFINDKDIKAAHLQIKNSFSTAFINGLNDEVSLCVKRFKYHYPKRKLPTKLITCLTGWNFSTAATDSALVIGLDMYLGDTSKFYQLLRYPKYQVKSMTKNYILPDLMRGWMLTEFDNSESINTLLNHTIFYGKIYYAINALLPNIEDSLLISYSAKQINYCKENEKNLWGYFAEKNRLYENNLKIIRELTSDGPFTGAISKECPPRIAMWVGWQIVKSYMKKNNKVTLEELMNEQNAQKIVSKSKYRP